LCRALGLNEADDFPERLLPLAPESGRTHYAAGSRYAIGLVLLDSADLLRRIVEGVERIGSDRRLTGRQQLGGNFRLSRVDDLCAGRRLEAGQWPEALDPKVLARAAEALADAPLLRLRFVSPLRLKRSGDRVERGHRFLDDDLFQADRLMGHLTHRAYKMIPDLMPPVDGEGGSIPVGAEVRYLRWLDLPKRNAPQTTGGVVGEVALGFPNGPGPAARPLLLGQYIGAGKSLNFGFGHYRVLAETGLPELLRRAETLAEAAAATDEAGPEPSPDADDYADADDAWGLEAHELEDLAAGRYRFAPLEGRVLVGPSGKARALAVSSFRDRAASRRIHQVLAPAVDELLESSSFAFRRGLSRQGAAAALLKAYRDGLTHVVRADIAAFFDSVDWERIRFSLQALWDDDPVIELLMDQATAPVRFGDSLIRRDRGLPQGAVLSPLLSNLFLDDFDEEVILAGFKLVRYADDFVICCSSAEEARSARDLVRQSLSDLGLELSDEKTRLTTFEQGFSYLGYTFCRSLILDDPKKKGPEKMLTDPEQAYRAFWEEAVRRAPRGAWLSGLELRPLEEEKPLSTRPPSLPARSVEGRRPVFLSDPKCRVRVWDGRLIVGEAPAEEIPLGLVEAVVCLGPVFLASPVLAACLRHRTPVFFLTASGRMRGRLALPEDEASVTVLTGQLAFSQGPPAALAAARELVAAKIANSRMVIRRQGGRDRADDQALADLKAQQTSARQAATFNELLGLEGRAGYVYFNRFQAHLPSEFEFQTRIAPDAPDPVNAMLNFGYSLLHRLTTALITVQGLHPGLGFYHRPSDRYEALASDLMEPFRYLVDLIVLRLTHRGQVTPADFSPPGRNRPCLMLDAARTLLLRQWRERLDQGIRPEPGAETMTYLQLMDRQIRRCKRAILNPDETPFHAFYGR